MTPSLCRPMPGRVVYTRIDRDLGDANWISSLSGGSPVRLTNVGDDIEYGRLMVSGWQPVCLSAANGHGGRSLMVVKTSGDASPAVIHKDPGFGLPLWSPDGQWIACLDQPNRSDRPPRMETGFARTVKRLVIAWRAELRPHALAFSADSQRVYGIRPEPDHNYLLSIDIATGQEKIIGDIGKDFTPGSYVGTRTSPEPGHPTARAFSSRHSKRAAASGCWKVSIRQAGPWNCAKCCPGRSPLTCVLR